LQIIPQFQVEGAPIFSKMTFEYSEILTYGALYYPF